MPSPLLLPAGNIVLLFFPTACGGRAVTEILPQGVGGVSTHALCMEGDRAISLFPSSRTDFYPPTPFSRRATLLGLVGHRIAVISTRTLHMEGDPATML